jgi:hypothetical protein
VILAAWGVGEDRDSCRDATPDKVSSFKHSGAAGVKGNDSLARPFSDWRGTIILRTLEALLTPGSHVTKLLRVPWTVVFPPRAANRYRIRFHLERMARMLRAIHCGASRERIAVSDHAHFASSGGFPKPGRHQTAAHARVGRR